MRAEARVVRQAAAGARGPVTYWHRSRSCLVALPPTTHSRRVRSPAKPSALRGHAPGTSQPRRAPKPSSLPTSLAPAGGVDRTDHRRIVSDRVLGRTAIVRVRTLPDHSRLVSDRLAARRADERVFLPLRIGAAGG